MYYHTHTISRRSFRLTKLIIYIKFTGLLIGTVFLNSCQAGEATENPPQNSVLPASPAVETPKYTAESPTTTATTGVSPNPVEKLEPGGEIPLFEVNSKVEISLSGPASIGLDPQNNPFGLQVDVELLNPGGELMTIPAFFDGDGSGGLDGDVWRFRFVPDQPGIWDYSVRSDERMLDGLHGSFEVGPNTFCNQEGEIETNLFCKGILRHTGAYYLQFQNGEYWIKTGLDDPENFLGSAFGDWQAKRNQVDLLSHMGVNSIYAITNNIDGDRRDTWPWIGESEAQAKINFDRFDLAKLREWDDFFAYAQQRGIVLHLVLNDDSAWTGYDLQLYLREMVARFGYLPGIIWNVGEEANEVFSDLEQENLAGLLQDQDPFDHPVTVHRKAPWPFLGNPAFDLTSIQMGDGSSDFSLARLLDYNEIVIEHRQRSDQLDHVIPIMIDETPRITEVNRSTREKFRTQVLFPIYLGGGNFELHYRDAYGQNGLVTIQDLEPLIEDMIILRRVLENLPFAEMQPCNQLLSNPDNLCFGESGQQYLIYLPGGGTDVIDLPGTSSPISADWVDPRTGEMQRVDIDGNDPPLPISAPDEQDWMLLIRNE
jgi:hypothetical protein